MMLCLFSSFYITFIFEFQFLQRQTFQFSMQSNFPVTKHGQGWWKIQLIFFLESPLVVSCWCGLFNKLPLCYVTYTGNKYYYSAHIFRYLFKLLELMMKTLYLRLQFTIWSLHTVHKSEMTVKSFKNNNLITFQVLRYIDCGSRVY